MEILGRMVLVIIVAVVVVVAAATLRRERRSPQQQGGVIKRSGLSEIRRGEETASIVLRGARWQARGMVLGEPSPVEASDDAFRAERNIANAEARSDFLDLSRSDRGSEPSSAVRWRLWFR